MTNSLEQIAQAAPQAQGLFTAWNAVALGAGAFLTGVYHHIVAAGGIKNIARNLWSSGPVIQPIGPEPEPKITNTAKTS